MNDQPDCDICRECGDHAEFEGGESNCCAAPAYSVDEDADTER